MTREERRKERDEIKAKREEKKKTAEEKERQEEELRAEAKRKKGWFQKIPAHVLLSPTGIVLAMFALIIEIIDLIPLPFVDQLWELPLEIAFIIFFLLLVKNASFKAMVIPFILERIPIVSDILPTWFLKVIM